MLIRSLIAMILFSLQVWSTELPLFTIIPEVLEESEIQLLQQLTEDSESSLLWYGRYNFWREGYYAEVSDNDKNVIFIYPKEHDCHPVIDKLSNLFFIKLQELGIDITNRRIVLESYLDRNVVDLENAASSGMFWHRDSIMVDGHKEVADFTMIFLMSGKNQDWAGADLVLQLGGDYLEEGSYIWVNSDCPKITLKPCYNQAIIFKNSNTGHMVTPLTPLSESTVWRDVFIITCYFK